MNIVGFSSGVTGRDSNADRMVRSILDQSSEKAEFVKLTDLSYSGCKGCVQLCAEPRVCRLVDDLLPYYQKIKDADAVVVGSPVYMGDINATMGAFVERFFGYRHVTIPVQGKPFVLVVCGHRRTASAVDKFRNKLKPFRVEIVDVLEYVSESPPCLSCGRHHECSIGGLFGRLGEAAHSLEITPELFHRWEDDPRAVQDVGNAVARLGTLIDVCAG